ncbi:MAG: oxygenase MpaB family protein, partial [Candidatus Limnocylindrales bacterium]
TRLAGTLRSYLRIVYGTLPEARDEIRRLNRLHDRVRGGPGPGATAYDARDPALALWVHATLVDSTMAVAAAWHRPLARAERARLYAESLPVGRAFGIPATLLPADAEAFDAYVRGMLDATGPVHPDATSRELALAVLSPPPGPGLRTLLGPLVGRVPAALHETAGAIANRVPPWSAAWLLWPAVGLLPPSLREEYDIAWGLPQRAVASWLVAGWRAWNDVVPEPIRWMPQAQRAHRRVAHVFARQ